ALDLGVFDLPTHAQPADQRLPYPTLVRSGGGEAPWVRRSPWGGPVGRFWNPENKIPCSAPPFGELVAVDVNRGEIAWKVPIGFRSEEHTSELQSRVDLVCRVLLERRDGDS